MHAMAGEVSLQPLHAPAIGGESMLTEDIHSDAQHVGRVEQRLVLVRDEVEGRGPADNPSTCRPASTLTTLGLSSTTTTIPHASVNTLAQPQFGLLFLQSPQCPLCT
jgi:hypothetical protein